MSDVVSAVRPLTADDVDDIVALATLCEIAETGEPDAELVDWLHGGSALQSFKAFGIDDDAGLAAFGYVDFTGGHQGFEVELRVRPGLSLDLGLPVLDAVRETAALHDGAKPLHMFVNSQATAQRRWLESQGAVEIRHFWRMAIDLDETPPVLPEPPPGVTVRRARDDEHDLRTIFAVTDTSFAEHFGHTDDRTYEWWIETWRSRRGFDLSLWWVAEIATVPVGVLLASTLGHDGAVTGHVGTLGTLKPARGRGIGTHLLRASFREFHDRGIRRVTLGVDSENGTGAVRLYESVGMRAVLDWSLYELAPASATARPDR